MREDIVEKDEYRIIRSSSIRFWSVKYLAILYCVVKGLTHDVNTQNYEEANNQAAEDKKGVAWTKYACLTNRDFDSDTDRGVSNY